MRQRQAILTGLVLVIIGIWALLWSLGYRWVRMDRLWPLVVIAGGIASLVGGLSKKPGDPDAVWFGVTIILCGGLFLYITLGAGEWGDLRWLWPAFPAFAGLGWVAGWLVAPKQVATLVGGLVALAVGIIGFLFTYGHIGDALGRRIVSLWPVILIVVGIGLVIQFAVQRHE